MERELLQALIAWKDKAEHLPLLLRGARQVGKTFLVRDFAKRYFKHYVEINFEEEPQYSVCFESLKPSDIVARIELLSEQSITFGQTLLFLDEIQLCPKAITALRYFKEKLPELHVIGAGSLLEFVLTDESLAFPVGRIQYLYLKPLSFREYLMATGHDKLVEWMKSVSIGDVTTEIHDKLMKLTQEYAMLGGMPMVLQHYLDSASFYDCQQYQTLILRTFYDDFAKYAAKNKQPYLQLLFQKAPGMVGEQIKYANISSDVRSSYLKEALLSLHKAGVLIPVYDTSGAGLPLDTYVNEKKFKWLFLDVGLMHRVSRIDAGTFLTEDLMLLNRGKLAEQWVGQELLAYQDYYDEPVVYYWSRDKRNSEAEIDYLTSMGKYIVPIEVKSGKTGSLRSLRVFLKEYNASLGVRISAQPLSKDSSILSVPFYLMSELPRLVLESMSSR